jgi:hypothetical protein
MMIGVLLFLSCPIHHDLMRKPRRRLVFALSYAILVVLRSQRETRVQLDHESRMNDLTRPEWAHALK